MGYNQVSSLLWETCAILVGTQLRWDAFSIIFDENVSNIYHFIALGSCLLLLYHVYSEWRQLYHNDVYINSYNNDPYWWSKEDKNHISYYWPIVSETRFFEIWKSAQTCINEMAPSLTTSLLVPFDWDLIIGGECIGCISLFVWVVIRRSRGKLPLLPLWT